MMRHLVVIKLGGGLITDKSKPFTARPELIKLFANELQRVVADNQDTFFLVGNGAGSFGHPNAHRYGLKQGAHNQEQYYGMCLTHNGVQRLNSLVVDTLTTQGIPAYALSPSAIFTNRNGQTVQTHIDNVAFLIGKHCVPVLHGDTICDENQGTSIMSTEDVLLACIKSLRQEFDKITVIYLMAADGVLDENGATIAKLGGSDQIAVRQNQGHDVTGGIVGKVASARKSALIADEVYLIDGTKTGRLRKVLAGESVGTAIEAPRS